MFDLWPRGFDFLAVELFASRAVVDELSQAPEAILLRVFQLHRVLVNMGPVVHENSIRNP